MNTQQSYGFRRIVAWAVMLTMTLTQSTQVAALTLATQPLAATTTSTVRPNLMYVLDDSGSMAWDYSPDYINDATVTDPLNAGVGPAGSSGDTGQVTISAGHVTAITAVGGNIYYATPTVVIEGGGGTGAAATATWNSSTKKITGVTVTNGGTGYTSKPFVTFVGKLSAAAWGMCWGTTGTSNQGGAPRDTNVSPQCTSNQQVPYAAAAVNYQYYDPAVRYDPPRKAAWTDTCAAGNSSCYYPAASPTAASSDGFLGGSNKNLTTSWPHEVWCNTSSATPSAADPTAGGKCRENLDTSNDALYPNVTYTFQKSYNGPASYYTMAPSEYCTDTNYTNCVRSTSPTVISGVTFNVPSFYRWCSYYNPLSHSYGLCQGPHDLGHYIPNYLGGWVSTGAAGVQATASLTINSVADGQSLTGLTIGGVDVVGGYTFLADATSTTTTIAQAVCTKVQANVGSTGFSCAQTGNTVLLQAAAVGTAANGQLVLASGPPDAAAANSTGEIRVLTATSGYRIDAITIVRADATTASLISNSVTANGNTGNTAQLICQAINSGPNQGVYIAKSGDPADPLLDWGTCQSTADAFVGIKRIPTDTTDNGATISISGPPTGVVTTGTITVNATGGETRLSDITLGGTSILTTKPLDYADGTSTTAIAADIASKITATGCTATASTNVVTITGSCSGTLAVSAVGTAATGTFRVSSTGHTNGADLGGIRVNTTTLVGHVTSGSLTNGTAVSTNATTLKGLVGGGFTAATPVSAAGGAYDVTVTAPVGNSYNGLSFTFDPGTASPGGAGSAPTWVFPITDAAADNVNLTSITCGGVTAVGTRNTGTTTANVTYVANLATALNTAGASGYTYSCTNGAMSSPQYRCTVTGPAGAAACTNLAITKDATITLSTTSPAASGGAAGFGTWTFPITGATQDSKQITSIKCPATTGTNVITTNTVSTGTPSAYISSLTNAAGGLNGKSANSYSWSCPSSGSCTLTGPAGTAACTNLVIATDAGITTSAGSASGGSNGTATWAFTINDAQTDSKSITAINCTTPSLTGLTSSASTGTTSSAYATALANGLDPNTASNWDSPDFWSDSNSSCTANNGAGTVSCNYQKKNNACINPSITVGAGLSVSSQNPATGTTSVPTTISPGNDLTFTISGANAPSLSVSSVACSTAAVTTYTTNSGTTGTTAGSFATNLGTTLRAGLNTTFWNTGSSTSTPNNGAGTVQFDLQPQTGYCPSAPVVTPGAGLSVGSVTSVSGKWRFTISGASASNRTVTSITCADSTATNVLSTSASTGTSNTQTVQRLNNLRTALNAETSSNGFTYSCPTAATNGSPTLSCTATGPATCTSSTLAFTGSASSGIYVGGTAAGNQVTSSAINQGSRSAGAGATSPTWSFSVTAPTNATAGDNLNINSVKCNSVDTFNTASRPNTGTYGYTRINNLATGLAANPANGYTTSCTPAATAGSPSTTCTVTGADNCTSLGISQSSGSTITIGSQTHNSTGATSPTWTFDIQNATSANKTISAITCNGSSILSGAPSTGTSPASSVYQRINNLTGASAGPPAVSGSVGPTNGYTWSCQAATATSTQPSCTLTGPVGLAACNGATLTFTKDSTISIGSVTFTNGSAANTAVDDFAPSLSTQSVFSIGRAPQGATAAGVAGVATGTISTSTTAMSNGSPPSALTIPTNASGTAGNILTMSGGQAADTSTNHWSNVGVFKRVDVKSSNNVYSRASGRTDCAGVTCTYNEEIQNFANWYTYYHTRTSMMKSATSFAFSQLDGKYRLGFDNICQATGTTVKQRVAQFIDTGGETANQRTTWWNNLVNSSPSCSTPLRAETAKIGRYYAGKLTSSGDPLQYSCQQNFMILVTDGYWNENEPSGTSILAGDIGNADNNIATAPRPYYDGAQASTTCPSTGSARNTNSSSCRNLSDITWYYYANDLRSSAKEVTVTTTANHGLSPGQLVTISGVVSTPPAADPQATYNGTVAAYVTGPTTFRYVPANNLTVNPTNDPGTYVSGGTVTANGVTVNINAASWVNGLFSNATNTAGTDVASNNVLSSLQDQNQHQHMNFYAMGLGIDGSLQYRSDYQTAGVGDYYDIRQGTQNWPAVANLDPTGVDDLWHATVTGHGKYFSARNLPNVVTGLREALNEIGSRVGSAAAAATSNLRPVSGDNYAYVASYATQDWVGDLQSRTIDITTGNVSPSTDCTNPNTTNGCAWSVQTKLDNLTWSVRRIYVKPTSGVSGDPLRVFNWTNLLGTEQALFNPSSLSQYTALSVSNASDITGQNLVDYLRGNRGLEQDGDTSHAQIWRLRKHVMGDIVDTQPVYSKAPSENYSYAGYSDFKTTGTAANRKPVVFVSSQDGMLHAFNAYTSTVTVSGATVQPGEEMWAYIPSNSMQNMKLLADINYPSNHRYFVDGPITIADVNFGATDSDWHTILIGGHGAGGTAYFALDITDPLNPSYLWEFTDTNLGYTVSNPEVRKLPNGEWAVLLTSGYNNNSGGGDGVGHLYALNPKTGVIKTGFPLSTGSGTSSAPSNLGKIEIWPRYPKTRGRPDAAVQYVYSGDLNGDLWRFDLNNIPDGSISSAVFKLAYLNRPSCTDPAAPAAHTCGEPITTKPELATTIDGSLVVYVGTGKYLETADLTNTDVQSIYAIKDTLGADNLTSGAGQLTWTPRTDTKPISGVTSDMFLKRKLISTKEDGTPVQYTDEYGQLVPARAICAVAKDGTQPTLTTANVCNTNGQSVAIMDWTVYGGWMVDLPDSGERVNVDPALQDGTLVVASNVPSASTCTVAGTAWINFFDYSTGLAVQGETIVSRKVKDSLVVGITTIILPSGVSKVIVTKSNYQQETQTVPTTSPNIFQNKRSLWREFEAF